MELSEWQEVIGNVTGLFAIIQFLTGIPVCREYVRKGTTGEASGLPFVMGALNCGIWLKYGIYTSNSPLAVVNFVGFCCHCSYTVCYYLYTIRSRLTIQKQITFAIGFLVTVLVVTDIFGVDPTHVRYILGLIGCCLSVAFFAAPLASVSHVFRTGSTEVLPFAMIVANFISGSLWWLYGLLIDDNFVKIPNFLGWCLACFQLLLYAYFPSKTSSSVITQSAKRKETLLNID